MSEADDDAALVKLSRIDPHDKAGELPVQLRIAGEAQVPVREETKKKPRRKYLRRGIK